MCGFQCELDVWVLVVDMLKKFLAVFCLADDKGVIHKPEPEGRGVGEGGEGLHFKLFHKNVYYEGTDGRTHSCTLDLLVILTLEEEVGCGKGRTPAGK